MSGAHVWSPQLLGFNTVRLVAIEKAPVTPVNRNVADPMIMVCAIFQFFRLPQIKQEYQILTYTKLSWHEERIHFPYHA